MVARTCFEFCGSGVGERERERERESWGLGFDLWCRARFVSFGGWVVLQSRSVALELDGCSSCGVWKAVGCPAVCVRLAGYVPARLEAGFLCSRVKCVSGDLECWLGVVGRLTYGSTVARFY